MAGLGQFFVFCATVVPLILIVWYVFSTIGRITRTLEDIAITLRRIEERDRRGSSS